MLAGGLALVVMGAALAWMVIRTLRGAASLGGLAMFFQAFSQGQKLMRSLLETLGEAVSNTLFMENLFEFLVVEPEVVDPAAPAPITGAAPLAINFRDVTFRYPSAEKPILEDFNLEIPAGQVAALLGVNGAGKSTLFKLLCRLYDPSEGAVEIGGRDIRSLELAELRRLVTVLFQDPVRYSETVRRNVELGQVGAEHADDEIHASIDAAGAQSLVDRLPDGIDTLLGSWFSGGTELSRRRVAAHLPRPRRPPRRPDPAPRRTHQRHGLVGRDRLGQPLPRSRPRPHRGDHLAPPDHRHEGRHDPRHGSRQDHRIRQPPRAAESRRPLRRSVASADGSASESDETSPAGRRRYNSPHNEPRNLEYRRLVSAGGAFDGTSPAGTPALQFAAQ